MRHRIGMAVVCLHLSAVLYLICIIGAILWFPQIVEDDDTGFGSEFVAALILICVALIIGIEIVAFGLLRRKFWAWVAALCLFGLYLPSLFFPLGAFGMWGVLDAGSRAEFGVGERRGRDDWDDDEPRSRR